MLLKVALMVLALYVFWRVCGRLIRSVNMMAEQRDRPEHTGQLNPVDELVQDPVCKLYVPRREAVELRGQDAPVYFCSEKCRDQYVQQGGRETG